MRYELLADKVVLANFGSIYVMSDTVQRYLEIHKVVVDFSTLRILLDVRISWR